MKFIIEPINDTDCRITGVDCSGLQGQSLEEVTVPATVEQDGRTWQVKEVGDQVLFTNKFDEDAAKFASLRHLKIKVEIPKDAPSDIYDKIVAKLEYVEAELNK